MTIFIKIINILLLVFICCVTTAYADIKLPKLINHGMVLQRDQSVNIWGWAAPNEHITATIHGKNYYTLATETGTWEIMLPAFKAGGPYSLHLKGNNEVQVHNILFGDVWLCSGQSNMELPIRRVLDLYKDEISTTSNDHIRFFHIPTQFKFGTTDTDLKEGKWTLLNPSTALQMSAVAYFFARDLYQHYQVPIGLIINAVGGSPAEAWLSEQTIKKYPTHEKEYQKYLNSGSVDSIRKLESEKQTSWHMQMHLNDKGIKEKWQHGPAPTQWKYTSLPTKWNAAWFPELKNLLDPFIGSVWFKKDVFLKEIPENTPVRLDLGAIIDADDVYINGLPIGSTSYRYPPRIYSFNSSLLNEGLNTITIRVRSYGENGEFIADKPYGLAIGEIKIDLKNDWKYQIGYHAPSPLPATTTFHYKPSSLYNALLYPLKNLKIKGVLWYQGESNTRDPQEYKSLFQDVISDWRDLFNDAELPFLYVQLANYMRDGQEPGESNWAELRQVQLESLKIPHTAMVTCIDIGEWNDIHPLNKKDVGKRLVLAARHVAYGEDIVYSGPLYKSHRVEDKRILIYFEHIGHGLTTRNDKILNHIAIAGYDGKYVWANAEIKDNHLVVWSDEIALPKTVRYGWGHNPESANLINKEGLPASPFTTSDLRILQE